MIFKPFKNKRIYLDYAATTPLSHQVLKAMTPYLHKNYFNPSAIYKEGKEMRTILEQCRIDVAKVLEVSSKDIVFTASGTEADNLALLGTFEASRGTISSPHIIISAIEHPGIKETAKEIVRRGGRVTTVSVDENGMVNPEEIFQAITNETVLVSIMLASNEIGVIEPISKISRLIKEYRRKHDTKFPYMHTDASQAVNYIRMSVPQHGVDMLTLDASKMYGPKGIGMLIVRPGIHLHPIMFGGGQEKGLRSGTESLALIVGFKESLHLANLDREKETKRLNPLKDYFISEIEKRIPNVIINTPKENTLPNIISISIPNMLAEFVAIQLDTKGFMVSTGSSCGNIKDKGGTETMVALGREDLRESTLRFSLGRSTTKKDLNMAILAFEKIMQP